MEEGQFFSLTADQRRSAVVFSPEVAYGSKQLYAYYDTLHPSIYFVTQDAGCHTGLKAGKAPGISPDRNRAGKPNPL
jgi:hypothetical protein